MLIDEVDAMLDRIARDGDWSGLGVKLADISQVADAYGVR